MMMPSPEEFDALTRLDFNVFVERVFAELYGSTPYLDNFHIAVMCAELEAVRRGEQLRLGIALPPRSLKSIVVSVAYPAWLLGHDPSTKIICASYAQPLADDLAKDCLQVVQSAWYKRLFPATRLLNNRQPVAAFETTAGGFRRATSVGGVLTGFGADTIIVDDPTKPNEAISDVERAKVNSWAQHTLFTRLNDKARGSIIIVMQRLHEDDLIGFLSRQINLRLISFPALALADEQHVIRTSFGVRRHARLEGEALHPEREPVALLETMRTTMGSRLFSAQYLQMPAPPGGSLVKEEWFGRFDLLDPPKFDSIEQSWDTGSKANQLSDYSVCTTWGRKGRQLFLLNVLRKRLEFPDLKKAVISQANLYGAKRVYIEEAAAGIALIQDLRRDGFYKLSAVKPKGDKVVRMQVQTPMIEAGLVFIPQQASWLDDYLHELMMFPSGRHDDQVDSTSQALAQMSFDPCGPEAWIACFADQLKPSEPEIRNIRVNCTDRGMQFHLITARRPQREEDGSFLVTDEEYEGIRNVEGVWRVEEP